MNATVNVEQATNQNVGGVNFLQPLNEILYLFFHNHRENVTYGVKMERKPGVPTLVLLPMGL